MLEWIVSSSVLAALMIVLRYLLRGHISLRLQYSIWPAAACELGYEPRQRGKRFAAGGGV